MRAKLGVCRRTLGLFRHCGQGTKPARIGILFGRGLYRISELLVICTITDKSLIMVVSTLSPASVNSLEVVHYVKGFLLYISSLVLQIVDCQRTTVYTRIPAPCLRTFSICTLCREWHFFPSALLGSLTRQKPCGLPQPSVSCGTRPDVS